MVDFQSSPGLSYEEVQKNSSAGNSLMPKGMRRQHSRASVRSNVSSRWKEDLETFKAVKITFYKNGDKWFEGFDFRFRPLKDYTDLESLLQRISPKIDFNSPVTHLFDTDGNRVEKVEDLEDRRAYVASNSRRFKAGNYGKLGEKFLIKRKKPRPGGRSGSSTPSSAGSKKPNSANSKVIKIVNHDDPTLNEKVLLNLKTSQTFEEVVEDLGQVLKIRGADRMYTSDGQEVKSFSHLRSDFSNHEVFLITVGPTEISQYVKDLLRNDDDNDGSSLKSSRSEDRDKGTIEVKINGARKIYLPPEGLSSSVEAPACDLGLQWVFGYRGADRQGNLLVLEQGELVYFLGTVVVVYDRASQRQRHYKGHTQDLTCIALHPGGDLVASGQEGGRHGEEMAHCRIWNVFTMETQAILGVGEYQGGIAGVSFSVPNDGKFVVLVDRSKESSLSVWDWKSSNRLAEVTMNTDDVAGVTFHPFDSNLLITFGSGGHLTFWNRKKDGFFARADVGEEEGDSSLTVYTCVTFLESGDLVAGSSEGEISVFTVSRDGEYYKSTSVQAHSNGVSALLALGDGVLVSAGLDDGQLVGWDAAQDFNKIAEAKLPERAGAAMVLCKTGKEGSSIYVGTSKNLIMEGKLQRRFKVVIFGHANQMSSLTTHWPLNWGTFETFASGGTDKLVVLWHGNQLVWKVLLQTEPTAFAFPPEGNVLAVGTVDGFVVVLNANTGIHVATIKVCGSTISAIKFNVDGDKFAAASSTGTVFLYKVIGGSGSGQGRKDDFRSVGKLSGGLEFVALDWDQKGDYIQTSSKDLNLQFWNANTYKEEKVASLLREKIWVESTCLVGWAVAGVWGNENYSSPTTITTVHSSPTAAILATGDSEGWLRLFPHPCTSPRTEFLQERLLSQGQVKVVRNLGENHLLAAGGRQGAIFKFELNQR